MNAVDFNAFFQDHFKQWGIHLGDVGDGDKIHKDFIGADVDCCPGFHVIGAHGIINIGEFFGIV